MKDNIQPNIEEPSFFEDKSYMVDCSSKNLKRTLQTQKKSSIRKLFI